ncbi:hypothetical protein PENNAL_c0115G05038 [Penicillium nalgiovense]|uniref:Mid2 domain-containing protein n=1 Tax=Penicillium nalgiovense TaxID=60175 RepID=A0A1V6X5X0_PENNA|nr:hypothetical protein PENNAL_c0115G05038 [Penicillium nalgiovense]
MSQASAAVLAALSADDPVETGAVPTTAYNSEMDITSTTTQGTTVVFVTSTQTATTSNRTAIESSIATRSPTLATSGSTSDTSNISATSSVGPKTTRPGGLSAGSSAGIGIGVALGVLLLAFVVFFLYRRRRKHREIARGDDNDRPVLPELGTNGQKHELSAEESRRAELGVDEQKHNSTNVQELE